MSKRALKHGWRKLRFDEIATNVTDRVDDPATAGVDRYVGLEHLDSDSLKIRRWGAPTDVEATKLRFRPGDIIFGRRRAYQRKLAVADFAGICSAHAMVLRAKPEVALPEFLPFFLQSEAFMDRAQEISVGSLSPTINWKTLARQEFSIPPVHEQRRLAALLNAAEAVVEAHEDVQRSARGLRRAYLDKVFSTDSKNAVPVRELGEWVSGGTPSRSRAEFWGNGVPWVSPKDMKTSRISNSQEHITQRAIDAGARIIPAGCILVVVRGMILAHSFPVALTEVPVSFNQDMKALIVGPRWSAEFVQHWFEWAAPRYVQMVSEATHGTKRLDSDQLFSLAVPSMGLQEQERHVGFIRTVDNIIAMSRQRAIATRGLRRPEFAGLF